ncbi:MAG: hemolysin III family protein [Bacteroidia bacterium]|nr:hemolysin III family protein [Bacteroidia bacterium]
MNLPRPEKTEMVNAITHGIGVLIYIAFIPLMFAATSAYGSFAMSFASAIYSFGLIFTFSASTIYHAVTNPDYKYFMRILDHIAIFFLIAGTYTPFIIRYIGLVDGYKYLIMIWALALSGAVYKLFFTHGSRVISVILYLSLGWIAVFFYGPMSAKMSGFVLWMIIAGGACFSVGSIFYLLKKIPYNHAIWHVFVLAGSAFHFTGVVYSIMYA